MRRVRLSAAVSLDGYIAGPKGEHDWIVLDPDLDFGALMSLFDTVMMGGVLGVRARMNPHTPSTNSEET